MDQLSNLGKKNVLNRINAYVSKRTESKSRRQKVRQMLGGVYDRTNAGVHDTVTQNEAKAVLFGTYLVLGEIISLPEPTA
jgi:hypothetical protein